MIEVEHDLDPTSFAGDRIYPTIGGQSTGMLDTSDNVVLGDYEAAGHILERSELGFAGALRQQPCRITDGLSEPVFADDSKYLYKGELKWVEWQQILKLRRTAQRWIKFRSRGRSV